MGGNALVTKTRRYEAEEYHSLTKEVFGIMGQLFPFSSCSIIKSYRNKQSFGDMDVLLCSENLTSNWVDIIKNHFKPNEVVKNGNCLSFDYKELQIDIIVTKKGEYDTSVNYFAYNDLGNLLGRLAHSIGLKLGHDGLSYTFSEGTWKFKTVNLTKNWEVICDVLQVSYNHYKDGFDDLEDIFSFVVSSPFFNKHIFGMENRNHASRVRDAKRKTYVEFLRWIEADDNLLPDDYYYKTSNNTKVDWLLYITNKIEIFPTLYRETMLEWEEVKKFKARYNGELVSSVVGLQGKELGEFMKFVKEHFNGDLQKVVNALNIECIKPFIVHMHKLYTRTLDKVDLKFVLDTKE